MIKYNLNTINDWNFGDDNIIKVYRNNAVCYYKIISGGSTPTYDLCFAVVDDVSQYQETEFEDVYDKTTEKWYKLNNLNQYEEYGVYVDSLSGSTRLPQGYTEVEYVTNNSNAYIDTGLQICSATSNTFKIESTLHSQRSGSQQYQNIICCMSEAGSPYQGFTYRFEGSNLTPMSNPSQDTTFSTVNNGDGTSAVTITCNGITNGYTHTYPLVICAGLNSSMSPFRYTNTKIYSFKLTYNNALTLDYVPCKRDSDDAYGLYDLVRDTFVASSNNNPFSGGSEISNEMTVYEGKLAIVDGYEYMWSGSSWVNLGEVSGTTETEYPKYYDDKSAPLDDLTFNTMAEAQTYAYNNCVYNGMKAIINGDRYYFDSTDENGWVKVTKYYKVEDVTPNGASGWTITNSATYNPDSSYYDDFDLETNSTSLSFKIAKVTIYGYDHFTYYLRTYHNYSSSYSYVMATNVDEISTPPSIMTYNSSSAITNTYYLNKYPKSAVNLSNYRRVTYNNLDKTVEHTFYVYFYGRTYSSYKGDATILIPKDQTNENWEQVTFSASSNVASTSKDLYIDNNYSTSGGTQYFYYRWMVGLPSGSHSSYSNHSSYDYCPNVTSSTFTSVAGNSRQVNYSWDATTNKSLRLWLVDTSGNTLTPTNTVYYYSHNYNSCNISSYSNITFATSNVSVYFKNGGRFTLSNSRDRHYIYGYAPPMLGAIYDVDDYENDFYIRYTKLDDEAVTITYTTYDPNDSETPTFETEITYPYNGGTKVTTATTSYNVPYTYSYSVSQASNKYSAATQTFTASQASRTVTFTLYPDNREFASVADMEAYEYAWEGMQASVNGTGYKYTNGEWVEQTYTQYEYIQTQTGNYRYDFNTNFYPTTANTIELKFTLTGNSIDWGRILCWASCNGDSCDSTQFRFTTVTGAYAIIGRKGNASGTQYYVIGNGKTLTVTLPLSSSTYTYNTGSTNTTCNYNVGAFSLPSSTPMHIFNLGYASDNRYAANVKLYYVKVYYGNGNLVKHYVPSDSNGTPCLYEIVNGTYILDTWTGSNHGTLTLGSPI